MIRRLISLCIVSLITLTSFSLTSCTSVPDPFASFTLGTPKLVEFRSDEDLLSSMTDRERDDQYLDWMMYAILANSNLKPDEINKCSFDLPSNRLQTLKALSSPDYSSSRSLAIGEGTLVALIPETLSTEQKEDRVAQIADEYRKNGGEIPSSIEVFEYRFGPKKGTPLASVTRRDRVDGNSLFSENSSYVQRTITNLEDLKEFLQSTDDLTFASVSGTSLTVGGRKSKTTRSARLTTEDIAALIQSFNKSESIGFSLDPTYDYEALSAVVERKAKLLKAVCKARPKLLTEAEATEIERSMSELEMGPLANAVREAVVFDNPLIQAYAAKLIADAQSIQDQDDLRQWFREASWFLEEARNDYTPAISESQIEEVRNGLKQNDEIPLLTMIDSLAKSDSTMVRLLASDLQNAIEDVAYQHARYDGDLQGTEVGMVLFYTDLLAKLWAIDYADSTPSATVADFRPLTKPKISNAYFEESKLLSNARLWFGPDSRSVQLLDNGDSLTLGHLATRIYAASHSTLSPGDETDASQQFTDFLGWFDDHYEEIASVEPQYERLNQIMKWTLVMSWLKQRGHSESLQFLQTVAVNHKAWFPEWLLANRSSLAFRDLDSLHFEAKDSDTATERLPLLTSAKYELLGQSAHLRGGVSLADVRTFQSRKSIEELSDLPKVSRRGNTTASKLDGEELSVQIAEGIGAKNPRSVNYSFASQNPEEASVTAVMEQPTRFRMNSGEVSQAPLLRKTVASANGRLEILNLLGDTEVGLLSVENTPALTRVSWRSRDIDRARTIALDVSEDPKHALDIIQKNPDVETILASDSENTHFVKMVGCKKWIKLHPESTSGTGVPKDYNGVFAGSDPEDIPIAITWLEQSAVDEQVAAGHLKSAAKARSAAGTLEYVDRLIDEGNFGKALNELDSIPPSPENSAAIDLRKLIAMLNRNEVSFKVKGPSTGASADFHREISGLIKVGRLKTFRRVPTPSGELWIDDSFSVANFEQQLDQSISSLLQESRLYSMDDISLENASPFTIVDDSTATETKKANILSAASIAAILSGQSDDDSEKGKENNVWLIMPAAEGADVKVIALGMNAAVIR